MTLRERGRVEAEAREGRGALRGDEEIGRGDERIEIPQAFGALEVETAHVHSLAQPSVPVGAETFERIARRRLHFRDRGAQVPEPRASDGPREVQRHGHHGEACQRFHGIKSIWLRRFHLAFA